MPNEKELSAQPEAQKEPLTPGGDDTPTKPKEEKKDKEAANKLLNDMLFSPTASDSDTMIEIDKTTDEDIRDTKEKPTTEELLDILEKGEGAISEKYQKELLDKALKDPTTVEVKTPKGWMTVKDAIGDGFDLTTGDFTNEPIPKVDWEGEIAKLDPREQETIRRLTQPGTRQAGPSKPQPEGGDVIPGATGEPIPEAAQGVPVPEGAMGASEVGGTELPLGGV